MNVDEKIRAALRLEPSEDVARAGEWDAFELRASRRTRRRILTAIASVAMLSLGISWLLIRVPIEPNLANPSTGSSTYVEPHGVYQLRLPKGWKVGTTAAIPTVYGAGVEFSPPEKDGFVIQIYVLRPIDFDESLEEHRQGNFAGRVRLEEPMIAARRAFVTRHMTDSDGREYYRLLKIDWPHRTILSIQATQRSDDADLFAKRVRELDFIVHSLQPSGRYRGREPGGVIPLDIGDYQPENMRTFVEWLDDRVYRSSPELVLSSRFRNTSLDWLVGSGRQDFSRWRIVSGGFVSVESPKEEYVVVMSSSGGLDVRETITLGPGQDFNGDRKQFVVLAVKR